MDNAFCNWDFSQGRLIDSIVLANDNKVESETVTSLNPQFVMCLSVCSVHNSVLGGIGDGTLRLWTATNEKANKSRWQESLCGVGGHWHQVVGV